MRQLIDHFYSHFIWFMYYAIPIVSITLSLKLLMDSCVLVRKYRLIAKIPCPKSNFIFGHLNLLMNEQNLLPNRSITQAYFNLIDKLGVIYQTGSRASCANIEFNESVVEKSGIFKINLTLLRPVIHVVSADAAETILTNSVLLDKPFQYKLLQTWLGDGLLTSSGNDWRKQRKLLSKVFHNQSLKKFTTVINRHAITLCRQLLSNSRSKQLLDTADLRGASDDECLIYRLNQCHHINSDNEHWLLHLLINFSLDMVLHTVIGSSFDASDQEDKKHQYIEALREYCTLYIERVSSPLLWNNFFYNLTSSGMKAKKVIRAMKQYTNRIIESRINEILYGNDQKLNCSETRDTDYSCDEIAGRKSLLDLLIAHHLHDKEFSIDHIANQIDTFVFAGHDTTALALFYTLLILGNHPREQRRLRLEIDALFEAKCRQSAETGDACNSDDVLLNDDDLKNAPYLDAVIKESLRLFPPVPMIGREINRQINIDGYTIPPGTSVTIDIYRIQRDSNVFDDAQSFNPERFLLQSLTGNRKLSYFISDSNPREPVVDRSARREDDSNSNYIKLPEVHEKIGASESRKVSLGTLNNLKPDYNFIPFSSGQRSCIGSKFALSELKICLSHILRRLEIKCHTPLSDLALAEEIVLKPHNSKINISFTSRGDVM